MDTSYETDNFDSAFAEFTEADLRYVNLCIYNPHLLRKILFDGLSNEELGEMYRDLYNAAFNKEKPKYEETKMIIIDTMRIYHKKSKKKLKC